MADDDIVPYSLSKHPDPYRHAVGVGALMWGLAISPIFWAGNLIIDYALVAHSCYPGRIPLDVPAKQFGFVWPLVFAFHLFTVLVIAGCFALALRNWRVTGAPDARYLHFKDPGEDLMVRGEGRSRYLGMVAMGWASILFLIVATQTVSFYWVGLCPH